MPPPISVYPLHRENKENGPQKIPVRENTGNLEICQNTGNLVCSSCNFPDSKGKRWICLPNQFRVCNSYKSRKLAQEKFALRQGKNREIIGNFKMKFEWVPCNMENESHEPSTLCFRRV